MGAARMNSSFKSGSEPQQERSKKTVKAICASADTLFTKYGVSAVSLGQIARDVKIPTATIYRYFPNKEELVATLRNHSLHDMLDDAQAKFDAVRNFEEYFKTLREVLWDTYQEIHEHAYLHETYGALLSERSQKGFLFNENQKWVQILYIAGRRFLTFESDELLKQRIIILNALWNGTMRVCQFYEKKAGDDIMKESIDMFCRELELPPSACE